MAALPGVNLEPALAAAANLVAQEVMGGQEDTEQLTDICLGPLCYVLDPEGIVWEFNGTFGSLAASQAHSNNPDLNQLWQQRRVAVRQALRGVTAGVLVGAGRAACVNAGLEDAARRQLVSGLALVPARISGVDDASCVT